MTQKANVTRVMGIDYARYGEGEARLGWFNAGVSLSGDGDEWTATDSSENSPPNCADARRSVPAGVVPAEIAHLKMTLSPAGDPGELAAINLVVNDRAPELSHRLADPLENAELLLNLRAEADPAALDLAVRAALTDVAEHGYGLRITITHAEHFRPGQPNPTHRVESVA